MSATGQATTPVAPSQPTDATIPAPIQDQIFVKLARDIAMDMHELETILDHHGVSPDDWDRIKQNPYFQNLLRAAVEDWEKASNTKERVALKALVCIEEAMPEFFARMHDKNDPLPAKVKALEVFSNLAGVGKSAKENTGASGEKFSVTINLGADEQLKIIGESKTTGEAST